MPVPEFAPSVALGFDRAPIEPKARSEMHDLLALLKVRTRHAVLVTLLVVVQYWLQLASSLSRQPRLLFEVFVGMFVWNVWAYIIGFAVIAVIQTQIAPGRARWVALIFAVLVWVLFWTLLNDWRGESRFIVVELGLISSAALRAHGLWTITTYLLLAAWYYESVDRARRTRVTLQDSELARRSAERWLLELRLGALQARLDPQVLFDTLDNVGSLYRSHPVAAERLLDSLIDYLRLVLPHLKAAESTLEHEITLALAYARVLRTAEGEPLKLDADIEPSVSNACFPPMVMQPLCDMVARPTLASGETAHLHISASRVNEDARLCVTCRSVRMPFESHRLVEIRHALSAMFAPLVRIEATHRPDGVVSVIIEVPYVAAPCVDR
jgi:hypothetical protein